MADTQKNPLVGSLTLTGTDAEFVNSGDMRLKITGYAPKLAFGKTYPGAGSLDIVGKQPARKTGLKLEGFAPTAGVTKTSSPAKGSLVLTGKIPLVVPEFPPDETVAPETAELAITGYAPSLSALFVQPTTAALVITEQTIADAIQSSPAFPFFDTLVITGYAPPIVRVDNIGVAIENLNATTDSGNRYNICDVSGFKAKPNELVQRWDGMWVLPEFNEPRNHQDFVKVRSEKQKGALRPEPVGSETFIEDIYPSGVTSDDL